MQHLHLVLVTLPTLYSTEMKLALFVASLVFCFGLLSAGNVTARRPAFVHIGSIFTFNSTVGRAAKVAIDAAVDDINSNPSVLAGTKLVIWSKDTNFSGFIGILEAMQFMEKDVVAVIGPQESDTAHVISHVANELHVPLLSFTATDPTLTSLQYPYFIRTSQSDLFQMAAIAELVEFYGWKQVTAIYLDDSRGRNGVAALGDKLAERRCKISYKAGISPVPGLRRNDISDLLIKVALKESRVIVLHTNISSGLLVLSVAKHLEMMDKGYVWIATDWLSSVLDSWVDVSPGSMDSMQGVLTFRQHTADSVQKKAFLSRWSTLANKGGSRSFGLNAYGLYAYDTVWIIAHAIDKYLNEGGVITFSNDSRFKNEGESGLHFEAMSIFDGGEQFRNNILQTNFVGLTGLVQFDQDRLLVNPAYDIINVVGTGQRSIGYWSNYSGLSIVLPESLYSRPANRSSANQQLSPVIWPGETVTKPRGWVFPSNGKELRIGVPRRVSFREFVSEGTVTHMVKGFCIDVFTAAVNLLPYPVPYRFVPFGDGKKNPSFTELVNLVASNVYDGAVGDIAIVTNRTRIADFTQPFAESGLVIVASLKKRDSSLWSFLRPFTWQMWLVYFLFFIIVGAVVWILEHRHNDEFRGPPRKQIVTILWFSLSTAFFAHRENTVSCLGRTVLLIWLFVVFIIQASYTASLTSILTVQKLSSPITGIESLKASNDPIGFQIGSFAENYLAEDLNIARSRLVPLGSPEAYAEALNRGPGHGGVAAVVEELPYVQLFLSTHCNFTIVGEVFTKGGWGFAFPRDSPLATDLSTAILKLSENGDLQRIHEKWLKSTSCGSKNKEIDSERLQIKSFLGLFLICGLACIVALSIYVALTVRQFNNQSREESESSSHGSSQFGRIQTFLNFADKKVDESMTRSKRRSQDLSMDGNNIDGTSPQQPV